MSHTPIIPYMRKASIAKRKQPLQPPVRRLLDYQLIHVEEGCPVLWIDHQPYSLRPGHIALIQPNVLNSLHSTGPIRFTFVHFDIFYNPDRTQAMFPVFQEEDLAASPDYVHLLQPGLNCFPEIQLPVILQFAQTVPIVSALHQLTGLWLRNNPLAKLDADQIMLTLVTAILREFTGLGREDRRPYGLSMEWIPTYLIAHINEPVTVADLAELEGYSVSHFAQLFRKHFGVPVHQYLLEARIELIKRLLLTTRMSLDEMAAASGFSDRFHLSKAFKKHTGSSPTEFKANRMT